MNFLTEPLNNSHIRNNFFSGENILDKYLQNQAGQDVKRKLSACYVIADKKNLEVKGYYTLSGNSIPSNMIPNQIKRKLPGSYNNLPVILIGRLAVSQSFQGEGLGKLLLIDALKRCFELTLSIGAFAVIVDPVNDYAQQFYSKYGFVLLPDSKKMFITMKTISKLGFP